MQNFKDLTAELMKKESIELEISTDIPDFKFSADATILNQVLINLFTNAVEALKRSDQQKVKLVKVVATQ